MTKSRFLIFYFFGLFVLLPSASLLAQETKEDPYSDYSHLWAESAKKKKKKKKKSKKGEQVIAKDSLQLQNLDSLNNATRVSQDSLQFSSDSTQNPNPPVTDLIEQAAEQDPPLTEDELDSQEEFEEQKAKDSEDDLPIDDFRSGMDKAGNGSFTGGFTYTEIDGDSYVGLVLSPEFKIGKVGVGLNVPILYGLDSKSVRTEIFKDGAGVARLVSYIRYGVQKKDPVYVKVGQLQSTMIGYGGLVNNYTNTTSYEKRKVGLHYDFNIKGLVGVEGLYSDFDPASRNLLVVRPYLRPLSTTSIPVAKTLEMGAVFVSDKDQTAIPTSDSTSTSYVFTKSGISAFGLDLGITVLRVPFIQIDLFANYSKLNIESDTLTQIAAFFGDTSFSSGTGFSTGVNFRLHFIADAFSTDIRIERLSYKSGFLPQFFDASYEINKDARIFSLIGTEKMNGIYGSLTGHVLQKVRLGGSLLIPDDITASSPAVVQVRADLDRLADKFSFHGSYIKGNLTDLGDAFKFDERSLAKMRFIYHMNSFLATGVDYYWAFTPTSDGSYKATKYVMPYIGVSIPF
ncbi:MAG: hypothetical protein ABJG78_09010 [Cyclobacteriaceae bacterium]